MCVHVRVCVRVSLCVCVQADAGGDAPSEPKVDQRAAVPSENGLSHTPVSAPKPPSVGGHQPQPTGTCWTH